jgi:release factor glutamine methyltransferase
MMGDNPGGQTVGQLFDGLISRLEKTSDTPGLDAQVLLAHLLKKPRSWVLAHPETSLTGRRSSALEEMLERLEGGTPLPYVLGRWEFFGLEFEITPEVLIPRPETELLVEAALGWLRNHPDHRHAADIGTGSGCIGVSLAVNVPDLRMSATDISPQAVRTARRNAARNGVGDRMEIVCCDLFPGDREFDLVVANLPYIPTPTLKKLPVYGREPTVALDGGADGLNLIRRLLSQVPDRLVPGGLLLLEIEASEGPNALSLAYDSFARAQIHLHKDLSGHNRLLEVQV